MKPKKSINISGKQWFLIFVIIFVLSYFAVGYFMERPFIERRQHQISSFVAVPIVEDVDWKSWAFTDYSDTLGDKIVSEYDATFRFVADQVNGIGNKAFRDRMTAENLETIRSLGENAELVKCFNYQKKTNVQGEPYTSVNTWACVFDPNGIKGSQKYMSVITNGVI